MPTRKIGIEPIFHAIAVAIVLNAILKDKDITEAVAAAAAVSALARVAPTEKVDRALDKIDVPITGSERSESEET